MRRLSLFPRNLPGQIAALAAVALFLAQAINFALLLQERRSLQLAQITGPTVARLTDYIERSGTNQREASRTRVRRLSSNPVDPGLPRLTRVEQALDRELSEANFAHGRVITGIRPLGPRDPEMTEQSRRAERYRRSGMVLQIAIEQPGKGWLAMNAPLPRNDRGLIGQLLAQTLVLYVIVLIPLLWAGHRIAAPLRTLTLAAANFRPGNGAEPVEERGPGDVRAVIAAYNALRVRVTAMLEEKDHMLGAIGHDLRTPLAALRVRIESVEDDVDRMRMADTIDEMNSTLEDILSLARLGRPSEPPTHTDMGALIDAVVEDFRDLGQDVEMEEPERLILHIRPSLMRRAVRNLIENAVKYAGAAEIRIVGSPTQIAIEIADRGPGIPDAQMLDVFVPFTRLETSRNRETGGIGLGLALARAIVQEAGGDISLANRTGGGLVATIRLPR